MSEVRLELLRDAYGFMVTQALGAVARAGLADLVAEQPLSVGELATRTGLSEDALYRILRALAGLGIFSLDGDVVANTPKSEFLRVDVDGSAAWIVQRFSAEHYRVWASADRAFATGEPVAREVLGASYFDWLGDHPAEAEGFNRAMAAGAALRVQALAGLAWADEVVVDVGGGTGTLLAGLLKRHARLRGIVFDLAHAEARARANLEAAGVTERCRFITGDFFEAVPTGGDVYVLAAILHDWDDEPAIRILRACRAAMRAESRLLVIDAVVPATGGSVVPKLLDLHMLVLLGGRERTAVEWDGLLGRGGFRLKTIHAGAVPVLEGRPAARRRHQRG